MIDPAGLSSIEFRRRNDILFSSKIIHSDGWEFVDDQATMEGQADILDVNKNEQDDWKKKDVAFRRFELIYTEPALKDDFYQLEKLAKSRNIDVITQEVAPDLSVADKGVACNHDGDFENIAFTRNPRPLSSLVSELLPADQQQGAQCAIDTASQEFLIYKPRA